MKNEKCVFFLPTRKGSQRVKDKNTRPFAGIEGGLLENKLQQLVGIRGVDEIILSTNDEKCVQIASKYLSVVPNLRIVTRPDGLCLDTTNLLDLIKYVPTITDAEHIIWGHVTTPMADAETYGEALELYWEKRKAGYDSLVGVVELRNFLLDEGGAQINNSTGLSWPRTQDLSPLYEINHTVFIASKETYVRQGNRLGEHPFLYVMDKVKSYDVDWIDDFMMAELMYGHLHSTK